MCACSTTRPSRTGAGVPLSEHAARVCSRRRPLPLPLYDRLREHLARLGRAAWADDELHDRFGDPARIEPDPDRAWLKIARRGRLSPRQTAVLGEIAAWREREARRRDLPPGWLVKDPSLVEVARAQPTDAAALRRVRGLGTLGSAEASLIAAVQAGKQAPPVEATREPAPEIARRAAAISGLATVLLRVRSDDAGIASELVATRSELDEFARAAARGEASEHPLATGWRAELVGKELRRLLDGKIAVATSKRPPYVEIIQRD